MQSKATTVAAYLSELPADRRALLTKVRSVVRRSMPKGYKETMTYGMITYAIPLSAYPATYNGQPLCYAALAAQKHYCSLYVMSAYTGTPVLEALVRGFKKAGKKLDMGKSCIRFKALDDLPLDVIGEVIAATPPKAFIAAYEAGQRGRKSS